MIGDLQKQIVFDPENGEGTRYLIKCGDKEARLSHIFSSLKNHHKNLDKEEKKMIRDLCLMISNGKFPESGSESAKMQLLRFTIGYLLGKYTVNTNMIISAENVRISGKDNDDSEG